MLIAMAFENSDGYIPYEEKSKSYHFFSSRHKNNIKKIINDYFPVNEPSFDDCSVIATRRIRTAFVCTLIAISMLLAGFIGYRIVAGFHANDYNGYVLLSPAGAPQTLDTPMKKFKVTGIDKDKYTIQTADDNKIMKNQSFINKETDEKISIHQYYTTSNSVMRVDYNDETPLSEVIIDNKKYMHWGNEEIGYTYINTASNYTISFLGYHKEELIGFIKATVIE